MKCGMFFQNFSIIRVVKKELHLPKVEGVEVVFFLKYGQNNF
jgi:hypothetical protein